MTQVQVISDLHVDLEGRFPLAEDSLGEIVIVAGDVSWSPGYFADALWQIQKPVIAVLGNHEYYGKCFDDTVARYREIVAPMRHVHLLEQDKVVLKGIRFLGATLWGSYRTTEMARASAEQYCFRNSLLVRKGHPIGPDVLHAKHCESVAWLDAELGLPFNGPTVVVTHYPPTSSGCPEHSLGLPGLIGHAEDLILRRQPALWVHGHLHNSCDYRLGRTRVLCNPAGCVRWRNPAFNPRLCVPVRPLMGLPRIAAV